MVSIEPGPEVLRSLGVLVTTYDLRGPWSFVRSITSFLGKNQRNLERTGGRGK